MESNVDLSGIGTVAVALEMRNLRMDVRPACSLDSLSSEGPIVLADLPLTKAKRITKQL
jgi:hypothetical protein